MSPKLIIFRVGDRVWDTSDPRHVGYIIKTHPEDDTVRIQYPKTGVISHRHPILTLEHVPPHMGFED